MGFAASGDALASPQRHQWFDFTGAKARGPLRRYGGGATVFKLDLQPHDGGFVYLVWCESVIRLRVKNECNRGAGKKEGRKERNRATSERPGEKWILGRAIGLGVNMRQRTKGAQES